MANYCKLFHDQDHYAIKATVLCAKRSHNAFYSNFLSHTNNYIHAIQT